MINSGMGAAHVAFAIISMIYGATVLLLPKGNRIHRSIGICYVFSMLLLNITALFIYNLTGHFGVFHVFALVSLTSIIGGIVPMIKKWKDAMYYHYYFMNWSVVGLYAAFWAETLSRIAPFYFWPIIVVATGVTIFVGSYLIRKNKSKFLD